MTEYLQKLSIDVQYNEADKRFSLGNTRFRAVKKDAVWSIDFEPEGNRDANIPDNRRELYRDIYTYGLYALSEYIRQELADPNPTFEVKNTNYRLRSFIKKKLNPVTGFKLTETTQLKAGTERLDTDLQQRYAKYTLQFRAILLGVSSDLGAGFAQEALAAKRRLHEQIGAGLEIQV